jgi:hypothetical protein
LLHSTAKASIALKIVIFLVFDDHLQITIVFIPDGKEVRFSLKRLIHFKPELNRVAINNLVYIKRLTSEAIRLLKAEFNPLIHA